MIEVKDLVKNYGTNEALKSINFEVGDGEIVGFLGANGAGKTTTLNIISGYIPPTSGTVTINGINILDEPEKAKAHIGYLPDSPPVYMDFTVSEYLNFVAELKGVPKNERKEAILKITQSVQIDDVFNKLCKTLSKGYLQRVGLAQALIANPKVIVLDEPTVGLDPKQIIQIRDVIKQLGKKHTVIFSSHILSEVSALCDRVIIISKGQIVASGTPESLSKSLTNGNKMLARVKGEESKIKAAFDGVNEIVSLTFECVVEGGTHDIVLEGADGADIRETVFNVLAENKLPLLNFKSLDLTLEEIFLQLTDSTPQALLDETEGGLDTVAINGGSNKNDDNN